MTLGLYEILSSLSRAGFFSLLLARAEKFEFGGRRV